MATRKWGPERLVNRTTAGEQLNASTTVLKNGNFIVVWQSGVDGTASLKGQLFDPTGAPIGGELLIDRDSVGNEMPSVAPLDDGGFIVVSNHFVSPTDHDIYAFVYSAKADFKSRIVNALTGEETNPDVAPVANGSESIVVWEDKVFNSGDIYGALYNADGTLNSKFLVSKTTDGVQSDPAVTAGPLSIVPVIVWRSNFVIKGCLIGSDDLPGAEFQVSLPNADWASDPDIAYISAGRFVVTWTSFNQGGGGGIHARLFQTYGGGVTALGNEIFVNSSSNGDGATVTPLHNSGGFVVSWSESSFTLPQVGPDTSGSSIHLQAFDGSGAKIGGEIVVNTTTAGSQYRPSVTALLDDRIVVTWTDDGMTGGDTSGRAIRMQIVDPRDGSIDGSGGDDILYGNDFANDEINGGVGSDTLFGLKGDDDIYGGDGDDTLIGGLGADALTGGAGQDTASYAFATAAVSVDLATNRHSGEAAGDVLTEIENVTGSGYADTLKGDAGANRLDGGKGADNLIGGAGNDTHVVDNAGDRVVEAKGGGTDAVAASTSYILAAGQEVETLRLLLSTGSQNLKLTGNEFGQALIGNTGENTLNGGGGADVMTGGKGNDTYLVDNAGDRVIEAAKGGTDQVLSFISYVLASGQEIEALQLLSSTGTAKLNLTGNGYGQSLVGNNGANVLDGGLGSDVLTGRGGGDTFVFASALGSTNVDRITDFATEDTIRLSKSVFAALAPGPLAETAFKNISTGTADASDRILYKQATGELFYDADGSGKGAAVKFAVIDDKVALTHADILVV